ncbi:Dynein regulatory complex subunit 3 [Clonorchis sinensis]|uniref:Dynein regulatory complex subunit 3 n=1 Tax=Clonorchis sinensis TaxID=79923 RepID=A0A8T1M3I0_CLOSI|nr:Dynein regulatory complex subunit 3 [Clonorchis sinensis]
MARLYGNVEPAVINKTMLEEAIYSQGFEGYPGTLLKQDGIDFPNVSTLRLDYRNILKIDHLWRFDKLVKLQLDNNIIENIEGLDHLVHLRWLDLSFNNIQVITGLEKLVNLEDLSLYSNRIQRLENLDTLRKLEVLSIGRNKLTDSEDLIYLRKFPALRSLCLHGNPLCDKDGYLLIVNAFLPKLVFLDYKRIDEKLKEQAYQTHQLFVDELNAKEMNERELEKQRTEMDAQKTMHRRAFVAEGFTKECKGVFELGLNELKKRDKELADFWSALNLTKKENYEKGTKLLDEFKLYQKETLQELENLSDKVAFEEKMKDYNQRINALQYELMHNEFILVDQLEELIKDFELNMKDMIDSFIEHVEEHFVECREQQAQFNEKLTDLTSLVLDRFLRGDYTPNVSDQLITMFVDKSSVTNALQASHDAHLLQIDNLADSIGKQARDWYKELMDDIWKREGHQRNRNKVMELNLIVDAFRRAFDTVEANVRDRKFEDEVLTSQELQMTSSILLTHQPSF